MTEQPLATPADLAAWQAGEPALLIGAAQAAVRLYCGWHIAPSRTETVTVDGTGSRVLPLPTLYLTGVDTITENGTVVDPTAVEWSASGVLWRDLAWTTRRRGVAVEVTHGYDEPPAEVQAVILSYAARLTRMPDGASSETVGAVSVTHADTAFTAMERAILDRHRVPPQP